VVKAVTSKVICDCTNSAPAARLPLQEGNLAADVVGERIDHRTHRDRLRRGPVFDPADQACGGEVSDARDVIDRVALDTQDALGPERRGTYHLWLQRKAVAVAAGNVNNSPDALFARECNGRERRHPGLAGVIVGQRDQVHAVRQSGDPLTNPQRIRLWRKRDFGWS
jgi:hypothetical protein